MTCAVKETAVLVQCYCAAPMNIQHDTILQLHTVSVLIDIAHT